MKELEGIIPYLVSPVMDNGRINISELERLSDDLVRQGVRGLCALGSCGEFPYLSEEQKTDVVSAVVHAAKRHDVPAVAGVCGFSERQVVEEAMRYVSLGADAIVLMIQIYFPLSDDMIIHFIRSVSQAIPDTTIVLYSNPKFMHFSFSLNIFEGISDCRNVKYYKDASGNTGFLLSLTNRFGDRFRLFSASAHVPLFVFELGGVGWMAGPACIIPRQAVRLYDLFKAGEFDQAMALQRKIWEVNRLFIKYDLTACIKAVLRYKGYDVGHPVPPIKDIDEETCLRLGKIVDEIDEVPDVG